LRYLVDGTNFLGRARVDRTDEELKRDLVRAIAGFARKNHHRVICIFDGNAPGSFGGALGAVTVKFSGARSADDVLVELAAGERDSQVVVTSDHGLAGRVRGRRVKLVSCEQFRAQLQSETDREGPSDATDWEAYFSSDKNRNI
jgi:predicted RNA-binding protein with PIN domain